MRNPFDQYSQPENKVTHALATALHESPELLRSFLLDLVGVEPPRSELRIHEQAVPGETEPDTEEELERRGLPDMWIHDADETWSLVVECKVDARLTLDQLDRHAKTARRQGFDRVETLTITARKPGLKLPRGVRSILWSDVYTWAHQHWPDHLWAQRMARYFEIAERKMSENGYLKDGSLTTFAGIPFKTEEPYHYGDAKRVLRLIMGELRQRPDLREAFGVKRFGQGRAAITGTRGTSVWDFLPIGASDEGFTAAPHLTLGLHQRTLEMMLTLPNGMKGDYRSAVTEGGFDGFRKRVEQCGRALLPLSRRAEGARPTIYLLQRHYKSQRSNPVQDARMELDLRTVLARPRQPVDGSKHQPGWLEGLWEVYNTRRSNLQMGVGMHVPYGPATRSEKVLDLVVETWVGASSVLGWW
jgi:hypothetical protein